MGKSTYQKELEAWQDRRPKNGTNYDYEQWLEKKPHTDYHADGTPRKKAKK